MEKHNQTSFALKHFHLSRFLHNKYNVLVIADTFRQVALSMIVLFVPIFLYKIGFSVLAIAYYLFFIFMGSIISHFIIFKYLIKLGVKKILIASYVINIFFYLLLFSSEIIINLLGSSVFIALTAFLYILSTTLYWSAHHVYFVNTTAIKKSGIKLGIILAVPIIFAIIGPFLGGLLITSFSFKIAFLTSALLMIIASLLLLFSEKIKTNKPKLKFKKILDVKRMRKNIIYFSQGVIFAVTGFIWPFYLFIASIKLISIGAIYLLSNFVCSASSYLTGKETDKKGNKLLSIIGIMGHSLTLIFRALTKSIGGITIIQSIGGLFGGIFVTSLEVGFLRHAHKDVYNSTMNREFYMHLGRAFSVLVFIVLLYFITIIKAFVAVIIFAGISEFLTSFIIKKDKALIN